jgi:hypothetical protein
MDNEKLITGAVGVIIGWLLKVGGEYRAKRSETHNALYRLHNELTSIRVSTILAQDIVDALNLRNEALLQEQAQRAHGLIKALPPIRAFDERLDAILRSLTGREEEMARQVVTYYNFMRLTSPDQKPDVETGIFLFEALINAKCRLTQPFAWLKLKERSRAKADAKRAVDDFFRSTQTPSLETQK